MFIKAGVLAPSAGRTREVLSELIKMTQCCHFLFFFLIPERTENRLTFHPVADKFLRLLGGAFGEPVVTEQRRDLVGVHQLTGHEGQRAERHLFTAEQSRRRRWRNVDMKAGGKKKQNF